MKVQFSTYNYGLNSNNVLNRKVKADNLEVNRHANGVYKVKDVTFGGNLRYPQAALIILDGFGIGTPNAVGNPFNDAKMPFYNSLINNVNGNTLYREIEASGEYVGLPPKMVGNSEVGHNNLGAGRLIPQDLLIINNALADGSFYTNPAFLDAMKNAKEHNTTLHIMGLLSDGPVHSQIAHMEALIKMANEYGLNRKAENGEYSDQVKLHAFLDGRDVPEGTAMKYINEANEVLKENGYGPVASVMGMKYPMDRNSDWDMTEIAFDLLTYGKNYEEVKNIEKYIDEMYRTGYEDKDIPPVRLSNYSPIQNNDSVIFANFRPDRTIQLTDALTQSSCQARFLRGKQPPKNLHFVCMSQYKPEFNLPIAFKPEMHTDTLTEIMARNKYFPMIVTESEKKAHLTFFFDGKRHVFYDGTSRVISPSTKPFTPEMQLQNTSNYLRYAMDNDFSKFYLTNFANADMLGHTAKYDDCVKALEAIDKHLKIVVDKAVEKGIPVIITADHGNIESLIRPDGSADGSHTNNKVPFIVILPGKGSDIAKGRIKLNMDSDRALKDVAPSVLSLTDLKKSSLMDGSSLIETSKYY